MVQDLKAAVEAAPDYFPVLFIHPASVEAGDAFFAQHWPTARAIADPELRLYKALGSRRVTLRQMFGLRTMRHGLRALRRGNLPGRPNGSVSVMPGLLVVGDGQILWQHMFNDPGDHPDFAAIPTLATGKP